MTMTADTHVALGASSPKTAARVGTGSFTLGANEVAIKIGSSVSVANPQEVIGALEHLYRFAKSNISDYTSDTVFSVSLDGSDSDIVTTGHAVGLVSLYVDSAVLTGDKSHFLHRTYKRVIERLLEESK